MRVGADRSAHGAEAPRRIMSDERDGLLQFLGRGEAYGRPGEPVEQVTTHAAWIFLVGERAFKMKRPVRYSFLDFSTARAAPRGARGGARAQPAHRADALPPAGAGDPDARGRARARRRRRAGRMAARDAALRSGRAARSAGGARRARGSDDRGAGGRDRPLPRARRGAHGARRPRRHARGDRRQRRGPRGLAGGVFEPTAVEELNRRTARRARAAAAICSSSGARAGKVRHCHGDLHLGNIVLWERRPVLFDCLEFDPALATIDTFYDLAFLLMDLCHRELRPLAQRLLSGYLDATWDDAGHGAAAAVPVVSRRDPRQGRGLHRRARGGRRPSARERGRGGARLSRSGGALSRARAAPADRDRRRLRHRQVDARAPRSRRRSAGRRVRSCCAAT